MAHILLADDNPSMGQFLGATLRKAGHRVDVLSNGVEALAELQACDKQYDLMLTDVVMPGIDGVELARRAGAIRPNMKVMFIAGFSAVSIARPTREAANMPISKRVLSKPFHLRELAQNIDRILAAA